MLKVLLLCGDRTVSDRYVSAAEDVGLIRVYPTKTAAQAMERMFRDPFDALLFDDFFLMSARIQARPLIWPDHQFLLIRDSRTPKRLPESVTFCFPIETEPGRVLKLVGSFPKGQKRRQNPDYLISRFLQQIGVPVFLYGFTYLSEAIRLMLTQRSVTDIGSLNAVYDILSEEAKTNASVIEHAMRHAIDAAWMRADPELLERTFGDTIHSDRAAPSNAAFLFRAADQIRINQKGETVS